MGVFLIQDKFYTILDLLLGVDFVIFLEGHQSKVGGLQLMDIYAGWLLWLFVLGAAHAYLL